MAIIKTRLVCSERLIASVTITPFRGGTKINDCFGQTMEFLRLSEPTGRLQPHVILHTISENGAWFKLAPQEGCQASWHELDLIHNSCVTNGKTAVVALGSGREVHLVAMLTKTRSAHRPYFWGYVVEENQYSSCLSMLNLRCLAVVFDLDETLFVANTMKSFEDKILMLRQRLVSQSDPEVTKLLSGEVGRYEDDRQILLQYWETNTVTVDGTCYKAEAETILPIDGETVPTTRPVIRIPGTNIVLTRIFPEIPDTSVLVRLRPAWEELQKYFFVKNRKRFEAFVCTMAEKNYALEMWRLLDPEGKLIHPRDFTSRIISVKAGKFKSLNKVFHKNDCHPSLAVVVDDRQKVWEEKDQARVHLVEPYTPYVNPHAEVNLPLPVLCHVRNSICHIRADFYRAIDDCLCPELGTTFFDASLDDLPAVPDTNLFVQRSEILNNGAETMEQQQWMVQYPQEKPTGGNQQLQSLIQYPSPAPVGSEGISLLNRAKVITDGDDLPAWEPETFKAPSKLTGREPVVAQPPRIDLKPNIVDVKTHSDKERTQQQQCQASADSHGKGASMPGTSGAPTDDDVEEGELSDSDEPEADMDLQRRLLILQHGADPKIAAPTDALPLCFGTTLTVQGMGAVSQHQAAPALPVQNIISQQSAPPPVAPTTAPHLGWQFQGVVAPVGQLGPFAPQAIIDMPLPPQQPSIQLHPYYASNSSNEEERPGSFHRFNGVPPSTRAGPPFDPVFHGNSEARGALEVHTGRLAGNMINDPAVELQHFGRLKGECNRSLKRSVEAADSPPFSSLHDQAKRPRVVGPR